jgi:hypothetical protein
MNVQRMLKKRRPSAEELKLLRELGETDRCLCRLDYPKRHFVLCTIDAHERFGIYDTVDVLPLWRQGWIAGRENSDSDPRRGADEFIITERGDDAMRGVET